MSTTTTPTDFEALGDDEFRQLVRSFVEANYPDIPRFPQRRLHWHENRPWYEILARQGWLCPAWPVEYGGMGLSAAKQLVLIEEYERFGCARISDIGIVMLGPLLIRYGTEAQKQFFLPRIISGEHIWAQGYSEPNAGSDLAALRTEAVLEGEEWVINGAKTWTTLGNDANWIFVLVRTDREVKKQAGISFLLVPMDSPGITVRPILNLELHDEFSEVFFDNVRVGADSLVGEVNKGWGMAKTLLDDERVFIGSPRLSTNALAQLRRAAEASGAWGEAAFMDRYTQLLLDLEDHKALFATYVEKLRRGETIGPDVAILKLFQSELFQRITECLMDIGGENAALTEAEGGDGQPQVGSTYLSARPVTIFGGSSEIMRTVVAQSVLGLPR